MIYLRHSLNRISTSDLTMNFSGRHMVKGLKLCFINLVKHLK